MKKAILWDFDGTLSYPNKAFFTALHTAISECGYQTEFEKITVFLEKAYSWKTPDEAYTDRTDRKWWDTLFYKVEQFCAESGIEQTYFGKINARFREILIDVGNYCLYDEAFTILKQCIGLGYDNYLATNNYPEITDNLALLGIAPYFSGHIVSSHIGYEKPRAEFYDYARNLCGGCETIYMIGDNPVADIQGGKKAGLITIAVHTCRNSDADFYCENLADIPMILKQNESDPFRQSAGL